MVDVQVDFVEGGSLGVQGGMQVAAMIARHLRHFKNEYQFVVASRDYHEDALGERGRAREHRDFVAGNLDVGQAGVQELDLLQAA